MPSNKPANPGLPEAAQPPTDGATAVASTARAAGADVLQLAQWDEGETLYELAGDYPNVWSAISGLLDLVSQGTPEEDELWKFLASTNRPYPIDYFRKRHHATPNVAPDSDAQRLMNAFITLIDDLRAAIAARDKDRVTTAWRALEALKKTIPNSTQDPRIRHQGKPLPTTAQ